MDSSREHIRLCFGDAWTPVALVAPAGARNYTVEFLLDPASGRDAAEALHQVRRQLDFYLVELNERDPWAYAIYHCGTASNVYAPVHWDYIGPQEDGDA